MPDPCLHFLCSSSYHHIAINLLDYFRGPFLSEAVLWSVGVDYCMSSRKPVGWVRLPARGTTFFSAQTPTADASELSVFRNLAHSFETVICSFSDDYFVSSKSRAAGTFDCEVCSRATPNL